MEVDGAAVPSATEAGVTPAAAAARAGVREELLPNLMDDMVVHSRAEVGVYSLQKLMDLMWWCTAGQR